MIFYLNSKATINRMIILVLKYKLAEYYLNNFLIKMNYELQYLPIKNNTPK